MTPVLSLFVVASHSLTSTTAWNERNWLVEPEPLALSSLPACPSLWTVLSNSWSSGTRSHGPCTWSSPGEGKDGSGKITWRRARQSGPGRGRLRGTAVRWANWHSNGLGWAGRYHVLRSSGRDGPGLAVRYQDIVGKLVKWCETMRRGGEVSCGNSAGLGRICRRCFGERLR